MELLLSKTVVQVTGADAEVFLQGQLSNDITKADATHIQQNCYLQHQGKIIALVWVVRNAVGFYLCIENELVDTVVARLTMFKLMSEVQIEPTSLSVIGVLGDEGEYALAAGQSVRFSADDDYEADEIWEMTCIENLLPEVYAATSEMFTPELLNLDKNETAVSFSKGCYVGQEVVARMHYLGNAKRRMFVFSSAHAVAVADELMVTESDLQKPSGKVVRVIKLPAYYLFLATLEVKHQESIILIHNQQVKLLH